MSLQFAHLFRTYKRVNRRLIGAVFIGAFGLFGSLVLGLTHAATPTATIEAEDGTLATGAVITSDGSASGGSAIRFGSIAGSLPSCNLSATPSTFLAQVSAASAGQTVCLSTGNYGTWSGINKVITIAAQSGATPTMNVTFGTGDAGFTLDGLAGMSGDISGGAKNITIRNSAFTGSLSIDGVSGSNILIDHNTSTNVDVGSTCQGIPAHFIVSGSTGDSGVTISNNIITGGDADGIRADSQLKILNNEIYNVYENGANDCAHTDAIQFYGGESVVITGNYIHNTADGIVAYDGTANNDIEHNVINLVNGRYGIELYSDKNSTVRHNTLVYGTGCAFDTCGGIYLDHKSVDPAGSGTIILDNVVSNIDASNGSTAASNSHNMLHSGAADANFNGIPVYAGGMSSTTYAGYALGAGSPGMGAASDGTNVGI